MIRRLLLAAALLPALAGPAAAVTSPAEMLPDPAPEARARALGRGLRCLVCQNQSIDDSDADLARDLRRLVRERVRAGDSDAEVEAFVVARYGDFVLLEPPVRPATYLLWFGPALVLVLGGAAVAVFHHRSRRPGGGSGTATAGELSAEERARLERLLAVGEGEAR